MAMALDMGTVCAVQNADGTWRKTRVTGFNGIDEYTVTGPGGEFDYGNSETGVKAERLLSLDDATARGLITEKPPTPAAAPSVKADPSKVDTSQLERLIADEINSARTDPAAYADKIDRMIKQQWFTKTYRNGDSQLCFTLPGEDTQGYDVPGESEEFARDVDEAIAFLRAQPPLPALAWAKGLSLAARSLASDANSDTHTGGDGSSHLDRMARFGSGGRAENLGTGNTAFAFVSLCIVDYTVPDRGHRANIFNKDVTHVGIGCHCFPQTQDGEWTTSAFIRCVMNTGTNWQDKPDI